MLILRSDGKKNEELHRLHMHGEKVVENLKKKKYFTNPDILEKLISFCHINEIGSEYPPDLFDPYDFTDEDCSHKLAEKQSRYQEQQQLEKQGRTRVDFQHAEPRQRPLFQVIDGRKGTTVVKPSSSSTSSDKPQKLSKWDQRDPQFPSFKEPVPLEQTAKKRTSDSQSTSPKKQKTNST